MNSDHADRFLGRKLQCRYGPGGEGNGSTNNLVSIVGVASRYFNDTSGFEMLSNLSVSSLPNDLKSRYIVLASSYCLLKYVMHVQSITFSARSILIKWETSRDRMAIDAASIQNLELVADRRSGQQKVSLFGVVNYTKTKVTSGPTDVCIFILTFTLAQVGERLLRATLMSPSCDLATIVSRYDTVETLLSSEKAFFDIGKCLPKFVDFDLLCGLLVSVPKVTLVAPFWYVPSFYATYYRFRPRRLVNLL